MNKPIYTPRGRAYEYGELAVNIYTGCNHGCFYCYARKMKERYTPKGCICTFNDPQPRPGIVDAVKRQIERERLSGKTIFLCFSCDPYPAEIDTTPTRAIIQAIKESGNFVRILTKGGYRAERDFDLLDSGDTFGVTISGGWTTHEYEPKADSPYNRIATLSIAHKMGVKTWLSCEPVLEPEGIFTAIRDFDFVDTFKIGKLNYEKSEIEWAAFGREAERLCREYGRDYYIKEDLRADMEGEDHRPGIMKRAGFERIYSGAGYAEENKADRGGQSEVQGSQPDAEPGRAAGGIPRY